MKTIGMIVAVEIQSVLKRYGAKLVKRKETAGYQVLEYETDETALGGYTWQDHFNRQILLPAGTNELYFRNHDGSNYRIELNIKVKKD